MKDLPLIYDFNEVIDRKNTNSLKYDFMDRRGKPADVLPLWVADMDFRTPEPVIEALEKSSRHGIFGYSESRQDYFDTLKKWFSERFAWDIQPSWLVKTPGIVFVIAMAVRALTEKGDGVIIQRPVYYPFSETIQVNSRKLINNPLVYRNGKYHIDFDDFEAKIMSNNVKLFILCNPHNPVGRVWTRDELIRMGDICLRHGVIVVSDEIHADFIYNGHKHSIFAGLKPEYLDITITCTAPSKTFNLAGLQVSNIFIKNQEVKRKIKREIEKTGYSQLNTMGLVACQAAYEYGTDWLDQLKDYLSENLSFIRSYLMQRIPKIRLVEPEGTYLVWLDCSALNLSDAQLEDLIIKKAKLWLDGGLMFGEEGSGFQRINIACPRKILEKAMQQLEEAINSITTG